MAGDSGQQLSSSESPATATPSRQSAAAAAAASDCQLQLHPPTADTTSSSCRLCPAHTCSETCCSSTHHGDKIKQEAEDRSFSGRSDSPRPSCTCKSFPSPTARFIPQTDGAEEAPTTPPAHQEPERMPESEMMLEACYRPAPPPPPMTRLSRSPHHVLCRRCSEKQHSVHFKYCYKCQ